MFAVEVFFCAAFAALMTTHLAVKKSEEIVVIRKGSQIK